MPTGYRGVACRVTTALRIAASVALLVAVVLVVVAAVARPRPPHPYFAALPQDGAATLAHQGGDWVWPGNTMPALIEAHALGAHVLELDVHLSADGHVVVLHDDTVDRTTDGSGRVDGLTLEQLQALDAAYRWRPPGGAEGIYPYRGEGVTIPTLDEVFEAFPDALVNVELKAPDSRLVAAVCRLVRAHAREERVLVASFHQATLREFRAACPRVATAAGPDEVRTFFVLATLGLGRLWSPQADAFQVPVRQGSIELVTPRFVRGLAERNVHLDVWTINDAAEMRRLVAMGVPGLITDRPDLALALSR
jgi:glycerophosphoryl diester phosphodiesterase